MKYHVVSGRLSTIDLDSFPTYPANIPTLEGVDPISGRLSTIEVTVDPITLNGAKAIGAFNGAGVAIPDVLATNGVVHVIDRVLFDVDMSPSP